MNLDLKMAGVLEVIKAKDAGLLKATFQAGSGLQPLLIKTQAKRLGFMGTDID